MSTKQTLPRFWPILFILDRLGGSLHNHFFLQKYIYLSKVSGRIPIQYIFEKEEHGPYCIDIKMDAKELDGQQLIQMSFDENWKRWTFEILPEGNKVLSEMEEEIKKNKWDTKIQAILNKFKPLKTAEMEQYIYKHYVKDQDTIKVLNDFLVGDIKKLIKQINSFSPSYNSFLLQGSLEYCLIALNKITPKDIVKKNSLISIVYDYVTTIKRIVEVVGVSPDCLSGMDLRDIEDNFEFIEIVCKELGNLPSLEELDLAELKPLE